MGTEKLYFIMAMSPNAKHRSKFKIRHKFNKRQNLYISGSFQANLNIEIKILDFVWIIEITKFPFAVNVQLALRMLMVFKQEENGSVSLVFKNKALLQ